MLNIIFGGYFKFYVLKVSTLKNLHSLFSNHFRQVNLRDYLKLVFCDLTLESVINVVLKR